LRERCAGQEIRGRNCHAGDQRARRAGADAGACHQRQQNLTKEEQECHVVFLGPVRAGKAEVGLEFSDARPSFWRVAFPPEDWSSKHPEARTMLSTNSITQGKK
jgi:hypothetical protein